MKWLSERKKIIFPLAGLGLLGLGMLVWLESRSLAPGRSLQDYAGEILRTCSEAPQPPDCFTQEIPKLMDSISMEEAFSVTKIVLERNPSFGYCHTLAHTLSAREARKNPEGWKDILTRCPTDICNYGCLHGPLLERFAKSYLDDEELRRVEPELGAACLPRENWKPTAWDRSMCYHGMGHLAMYITNADVTKSVALCRAIGRNAGGDYVSTCLEGVFMQIFQPLEPEDRELIKNLAPSRETVRSFCDRYAGVVRDNCWRESWPLFREELMAPAGMLEFCRYPETPEGKRSCRAVAITLVTTVRGVDEANVGAVQNYCSLLPVELRAECFSVAVARVIQISPDLLGKAIRLCAGAGSSQLQEACFRDLAGIAKNRFHPGSAELNQYCAALPIPWDTYC